MTDTITVPFTEQQIHLLERLADERDTTIENVVARLLVDLLPLGDVPGAADPVAVGAVAEVR